MNKTLWKIIKDSKDENKYTKSKKQYENLHNILSKLPQKEVSKLRDEWADKSNEMTSNEEFMMMVELLLVEMMDFTWILLVGL